MNYQKVYDQLITKHGSVKKPNTYSERHHIIPKCLGGGDKKSNLIYLSAEAHFVAHQLLVKLNPGHHGLMEAVVWMSVHPSGKRCNNRLYSWIRKTYSIVNSERVKLWHKNNPSRHPMKNPETRMKISGENNWMTSEKGKLFFSTNNPMKNKDIAVKTSNALKNRWADPEFKIKMSESMKKGWAIKLTKEK